MTCKLASNTWNFVFFFSLKVENKKDQLAHIDP